MVSTSCIMGANCVAQPPRLWASPLGWPNRRERLLHIPLPLCGGQAPSISLMQETWGFHAARIHSGGLRALP
jgi:hypothetical protein